MARYKFYILYFYYNAMFKSVDEVKMKDQSSSKPISLFISNMTQN